MSLPEYTSTSDIQHQHQSQHQQQQRSSVTLPATYQSRILVSNNEAGSIIGKEGSIIKAINEQFAIKNVQVKLDTLQKNCSDRVLTVEDTFKGQPTDSLVPTYKAKNELIYEILNLLVDNNTITLQKQGYHYKPLNPLFSETQINQVFNNNKVKKIQSVLSLFNNPSTNPSSGDNLLIKISETGLIGSSDTVLQILGSIEDIKLCLDAIDEILLEQYGTTSPVLSSEQLTLDKTLKKNYTPHLNVQKVFDVENQYVPRLVGQRKTRLLHLASLTNCVITIDDNKDIPADGIRKIKIVGEQAERAYDLLMKNYEQIVNLQ
ncbi:hypothetical protein HANVADRAFT_54222 [Hanseniaspora valbyensis NRRL Y-1626]|uniref:K Homology domain-containing protein n=1 Tax=Hanseniaspora valbyensis NRRL Y-1626 TaxID=766949 RepID=A0A1B7T884_9ASCO|nr:hypothetical protein HANVADRAFT_54222 [Hanseniaspora valbyensis NRRL Y-1626]